MQSTKAELEELYAECSFYSLASHLYWATWAIVQVTTTLQEPQLIVDCLK